MIWEVIMRKQTISGPLGKMVGKEDLRLISLLGYNEVVSISV